MSSGELLIITLSWHIDQMEMEFCIRFATMDFQFKSETLVKLIQHTLSRQFPPNFERACLKNCNGDKFVTV